MLKKQGFTQYLLAIPIPDLESSTLFNCFVEHFCLKFGLQEAVHSDIGSSSLSQQFKNSLNQLGIETSQTPVYSPEGNIIGLRGVTGLWEHPSCLMTPQTQVLGPIN